MTKNETAATSPHSRWAIFRCPADRIPIRCARPWHYLFDVAAQLFPVDRSNATTHLDRSRCRLGNAAGRATARLTATGDHDLTSAAQWSVHASRPDDPIREGSSTWPG